MACYEYFTTVKKKLVEEDVKCLLVFADGYVNWYKYFGKPWSVFTEAEYIIAQESHS